MMEKESFKKYPEYKKALVQKARTAGVVINLDNPKTIQDKINWMKLFDSTPLKTKCADKVLVHEYCKEKLGEDICIPIIKTYDKAEDIKWDELPEQFVIKCNHGSGMNIIVREKKKLDKGAARAKLAKWMKHDFSFDNGYEMHYHDIKRKILVEKFMSDGHKDLVDFKIFCFHGEPKMCLVIGNRTDKKGNYRNYYDMDFNFMNLSKTVHRNNPKIRDKKPEHFEEMKEYAKKLSEDFKFVRVDFYEIDGKVYLGELTFTPAAGLFNYTDKKKAIPNSNTQFVLTVPSSSA